MEKGRFRERSSDNFKNCFPKRQSKLQRKDEFLDGEQYQYQWEASWRYQIWNIMCARLQLSCLVTMSVKEKKKMGK